MGDQIPVLPRTRSAALFRTILGVEYHEDGPTLIPIRIQQLTLPIGDSLFSSSDFENTGGVEAAAEDFIQQRHPRDPDLLGFQSQKRIDIGAMLNARAREVRGLPETTMVNGVELRGQDLRFSKSWEVILN